MARKVRMVYAGATYHVMARGNERAAIFVEAKDCELFTKALEEGLERFGVVLHAYCLMPNHFHLALTTPNANLPRFMAWLQTTFTVRYNRRHRRSGHLFQGRYKAEPVQHGRYGRTLLLYIHLNPVRSRRRGKAVYVGGLADLDRFAWSSHGTYSRKRVAGVKGLSLQWLEEWGQKPAQAVEAYRRQLKGILQTHEQIERNGWFWGEAGFGVELVRKLGSKARSKERVFLQPLFDRRRSLLEPLLAREPDERVKLWARVRWLAERPVDLAREKGYFDGGTITQILKRLEARALKEQKLKSKLGSYKSKMSLIKG
jgi:REP element-mobilizing transposase RayT